jgi:peptidoglycan/LPS O-acetylase OafA/YrhL
MRYLPEIDGLRALAVAAVLASHFFGAAFPNGHLGVDIFFVISGFVITGTLAGRADARLPAFLAGFFARRIKRLFPALALVSVISSVLICLVDPTPLDHLRTGLAALFGLGNVWLYLQATDYFADSAALNPFTHTWSLGVEEQFYLVFPLLFWLGWRFVPRRVALVALAGLVLGSAVAWWVTAARAPMLAFYMVPFRFWQIGLGALVWLVQARLAADGGRLAWLKAACAIAAAGVAIAPVPLDARVAALAVTLATAGALLLTGPGRARLAPLAARGAVYLGRVSYSLYLWHWPVAVMLKWTVGLSVASGLAGLGLSLVLAHLTWRGVEEPLRRAAWGPRGPGQELRRGLAAMLAGGLALYANGALLQPHLYQGQPARLIAAGVGSLSAPYRAQAGTLWEGGVCVLASDAEAGKEIVPERCTIGAPFDSAARRVLVAGNSFAPALAAAFDLPAAAGTAFVLTASWGASPVPELPNDTPWRAANGDYWGRVVPALVAQLRPGDSVLLASDLAGLSPLRGEEGEALRATFGQGLRRLSRDLGARGIGLGVVGPLPFAREAACEPDLAVPQWYAPGGGPCRYYSRAATLARLAPLDTMLERLEAEGAISLIRAFDIFCPGDICGYVAADGTMLFRDVWSHPSVEAATLLRPAVQAWIDAER